MGKGSKLASHEEFKDKAKNRVDDLQLMFSGLQSARKESRAADVAVFEEQVHQMLREWKAELNEQSPANSLLGNNQNSSDHFSEALRLLALSELEDDATSKLAELGFSNQPKPEQVEVVVPQVDATAIQGGDTAVYQDDYFVNQDAAGQSYIYVDQYEMNLVGGSHNRSVNCHERTTHLDYCQYSLPQEVTNDLYIDANPTDQNNGDMFPHMSDLLPTICPPPSAFLRSKCALWDCQRPAQGSDWCLDYCSNFHATLALSEGPPGMTPVLRPGGIDLKDGPLFAALTAKTQGKNVGIPVCEGAATAKSPWNAPELFDLSVLEGESIREWLFFDKPRRAFESGNRKQRSLPDYAGRGWHESRKQVMKEFGGLKRSYYMDPQPLTVYEWHLYEYEISDCDAYALYRLEFKLVEPKKSTKVKLNTNSVAYLQKQMGKLNSDNSPEQKGNKIKTMGNQGSGGNMFSTSMISNYNETANIIHASDQVGSFNEHTVYGPDLQYGYAVGNLSDKHET